MEKLEKRLGRLWGHVKGKKRRSRDRKDEKHKPNKVIEVSTEKHNNKQGREREILTQVMHEWRAMANRDRRKNRMLAEEEDDSPNPGHRSTDYAESVGYESGYLSNLSPKELSPHLSPNSTRFRLQKSLDELRIRDSEKAAEDDGWVRLSRADTVGVLNKTSFPSEYLRRNVIKTKMITCVFEIANGGIEDLLDDVIHEFGRWFNGRNALLAVACEVQWSVPEGKRNRMSESKLKDSVLLRLRENNRRLLNLKGNGCELPIHYADATTTEKCCVEKDLEVFQGIYRRCYRNLLPFAHEETPEWHSSYWSLQERDSLPQPHLFLFGDDPSKLKNTTLIAINMCGLRIRGTT